MAALKSADHIAAILALINAGAWASDAIWDKHKDSQEYDEVALPDRATNMRNGMVMIERGRKEYVPNGKKLYADEADFWKTAPRHWPRMPFKATQWKRDYRQKDGEHIERKFILSIHRIYAVTREKDGVIDSIQFFAETRVDPTTRIMAHALIHEWKAT